MEKINKQVMNTCKEVIRNMSLWDEKKHHNFITFEDFVLWFQHHSKAEGLSLYSVVHQICICYFGKWGVAVTWLMVLTRGLGCCELWSLSVCSLGDGNKPLLHVDVAKDSWMADTSNWASCQIPIDLMCSVIPHEHEGGL